jgi:hypothetical protein
MKKQLAIIGLVAILVGVGLSGCNDTSNKIVDTSVDTSIPTIIDTYPKYQNRRVIVYGIYSEHEGSKIITDWYLYTEYSLEMIMQPNVVKPTSLIERQKYKITGIVRDGHNVLCYLEVSKIETT